MKKKSLIEQYSENLWQYEQARMKLESALETFKNPSGSLIDIRSFESEDTQRSINPESSDL